jgi:hypothetical protein
MMSRKFLPGIFVLFLFSCRNHPVVEAAPAQPAVTMTIDTSFFPVTSFLKGQMNEFDSLAVTPLHIVYIKDKADSQWIKREQLRSFLATFLTPVIAEKNLKPYFKESRFNDLTMAAVTLSYDQTAPLPDSVPLQSWNVYIDPQSGNVKRIYIIKNIKTNGQSITQQLTWENNASAQIVNILNKPDGSSELLNREVFIWNF